MSLRLKVSNIDLSIYGLHLDKGALSVFEQPPTPKDVFFNDWKDEDGFDYDDESKLVMDAQSYDIPFIMKADNLADYKVKKAAIVMLISKNGEFLFEISNWVEPLNLRFKSFVAWNLISYSATDPAREIFARIVLKLENNHK